MIDERYKLVVENEKSTVVTTYKPLDRQSSTYQSEAALEKAFIEQLQTQAYEYLTFTSEKELIANLRHRLEVLNDYSFSDNGWDWFFNKVIANQQNGIEEKTRIIQEDHVQILQRDNGESKNIYLLDKVQIHNNYLQVINQYVPKGGTHDNRYDVTILVNGLPLVHVELKRRGVSIKEAFNQINRYNRESFRAGGEEERAFSSDRYGYDQYLYLPERRAMMDVWSDLLEGLASDKFQMLSPEQVRQQVGKTQWQIFVEELREKYKRLCGIYQQAAQ